MAMIDCCRGAAALLVVFHHAFFTVAKDSYVELHYLHSVFKFGGRAVDFFFVLSGFIIAYVHWFDLGNRSRLTPYLVKRLVRLYPILWVVAIPTLLASALLKSAYDSAAWTSGVEMAFGSLALLPTSQLPLPIVVWTLKHELLFYFMFLVVIWRPRIGIGLLALWGCLCVYHTAIGFSSNFAIDFVLSPYNLEFLLGVCCGCFMRLKSVRFSIVVTVIGVLCFVAAGMLYKHIPDQKPWIASGTTGWQVVQFGLSSALIILGLSQIDIHNNAPSPKWLVFIGAASYSIYLIHFPVISLSCKVLRAAKGYIGVTPLQSLVAIALIGVVAGICLHRCIEVPLLRVARQALLPANGQSKRGT